MIFSAEVVAAEVVVIRQKYTFFPHHPTPGSTKRAEIVAGKGWVSEIFKCTRWKRSKRNFTRAGGSFTRLSLGVFDLPLLHKPLMVSECFPSALFFSSSFLPRCFLRPSYCSRKVARNTTSWIPPLTQSKRAAESPYLWPAGCSGEAPRRLKATGRDGETTWVAFTDKMQGEY